MECPPRNIYKDKLVGSKSVDFLSDTLRNSLYQPFINRIIYFSWWGTIILQIAGNCILADRHYWKFRLLLCHVRHPRRERLPALRFVGNPSSMGFESYQRSSRLLRPRMGYFLLRIAIRMNCLIFIITLMYRRTMLERNWRKLATLPT